MPLRQAVGVRLWADFVAEVGWERVRRRCWLFRNVAASCLAAAPHGYGTLRTTDVTDFTQRTLPFCPVDDGQLRQAAHVLGDCR